jgi:fructokinase
MPDIVTLGELLIDFVPTVSGVTLIEAPAFKKAAGGAAANVAAGLAKLGVSTGFMGKVGDDAFGHFLAQTLRQTGVDITALRFTREARTSLAFVSLRADGEREFVFYRHLDKDMLLMYSPDEVDAEYIRTAHAFHFGSISLITEPSRSASLYAIQTAQSAGLQISYDPNLRLNLWPSPEAAKEGLMLGWPRAHIIKVSEEELAFLTSTDLTNLQDLAGLERVARQIWHSNLRLLVVTRGKAGSRYVTPNFCGEVLGFTVQAVDTTGAGDGFVAGLLCGLHQHPHAGQDESLLREICRYANAVGAITTTERGAIPALPTAAQVEQFLQAHP